jgi:hypothetical protein
MQYNINPQIGRAKYSISYYDGIKTHKDGSEFWDIKIFKNKKDFTKAIKNYERNN